MKNKKPINWTKYKVRTCLSLHHCEICQHDIVVGQSYHDGGYGRRAHVECVDPNISWIPQQGEVF